MRRAAWLVSRPAAVALAVREQPLLLSAATACTAHTATLAKLQTRTLAINASIRLYRTQLHRACEALLVSYMTLARCPRPAGFWAPIGAARGGSDSLATPTERDSNGSESLPRASGYKPTARPGLLASKITFKKASNSARRPEAHKIWQRHRTLSPRSSKNN